MKAFRALCAALFYGTISWPSISDSCQTAVAETFSGHCSRVLDGDTIVVMHDDLPERIRLSEIDCPEKRQSFGQAAKQYTTSLALDKYVVIDWRKKDRYGRTIGTVTLPNGEILNTELVRHGYAWWYRKYSTSKKLQDMEVQARAAHAGLWQDSAAVPPWEFRHPLHAHLSSSHRISRE